MEHFELARGVRRWRLYAPHDPNGDGYVACMRVEVHDEGLYAETTATIDGYPISGEPDLAAFIQGLAEDWQGWSGSRVWDALEHEMSIAAVHDGRGYVSLAVTLRRHRNPYADDAWSAKSVFTLEAGEEMRALASDIEFLLAAAPNGDGQ
jgi:hypothetical protein